MILGSVAWSEALSRITASGSTLRGRGRLPSPIRSADDLREILGQAVGSQQRLCGDFRGFGFKVNPRVSHRLKLGHQGRADWRKRQEKGGWSNPKLEHPVEHSRVGSASPSRSGPVRRAEACQVEAQKQPESGPASAGPATAGSRCLDSGGSAQRCSKGGAHVRSGHLKSLGI